MELATPFRLVLPCVLLFVAAPLAWADTLPTLLETWGTFGHGPGQLSYPGGVCVEGSEHVYVADQGNDRVQEFMRDGTSDAGESCVEEVSVCVPLTRAGRCEDEIVSSLGPCATAAAPVTAQWIAP